MRQFDVTGQVRACDRVRIRTRHLAIGAVFAVALCAALLARSELHQNVRASEDSIEKDLGQVAIIISDDTLELSGPIAFGVTRRVRAVLEENPSITTVRLSSPGGRVVEARDLSRLITERGLTTVAVGNCASACTVLFMAGRDRLLAQASTLGFHRYHSPDPKQEEAETNMAIDRRYFRARGIPAWFIERAFATPNSEMWRPTLDEMKVANVVTGELAPDGKRIAFTHPAGSGSVPDSSERRDGGLSVSASETPR